MLHAALPAREVEGGVRPHQRPAQARALADRRIDVGDRCNAFRHQMHRFPPQRRLQAIREVARHFLADLDRVLADGPVEGHRRGDRLRAALGAAHHLDQRDQMRRVEGVANQHPFRMRAIRRQLARQQAGGRGGDHHVGRQDRVEPREQILLDRQPFRRAFLHEVGTGDGGDGVGLEAPGLGVGIRLATQAHQHRPGAFDHPTDQVRRARRGVARHHLQPAAEEIRRPGRPDRARADHRDALHRARFTPHAGPSHASGAGYIARPTLATRRRRG